MTKVESFLGFLRKKNKLHLAPRQFTRDMASQYAEEIRSAQKNNLTYNSYIESAYRLFRWIEMNYDDIIDKNPFAKIQKLKYESTPKRPFNKMQREHILSHLERIGEHHLLMACQFVYYSFIRTGRELHGIQIEDLDLVTKLVWINTDIAKNKKSMSVPLPNVLVNKLKKLNLQKYPRTNYLFGPWDQISEKPAGRDHYSKRFTKIIRALEYGPEYTLYSWKHTGNQVAHENGMPLEQQRRLNRHHSLDETQTYLSGLSPLKGEELGKYFKD